MTNQSLTDAELLELVAPLAGLEKIVFVPFDGSAPPGGRTTFKHPKGWHIDSIHDWRLIGELIEKYKMDLEYDEDCEPDVSWHAWVHDFSKPLKGYKSCYLTRGKGVSNTPGRAVCLAVLEASGD